MSPQPDDLLQNYLNDLLDTAPLEPEQPNPAPAVKPVHTSTEPAVDTAVDEKKAQLQKLLYSAKLQVAQVVDVPAEEQAEVKAALAEVETVTETVTEVGQPVLDDAETATSPVSEVGESALAVESLRQALQWGADGRPQWAQDDFEVLLFKVCGLTLAVPLITLGQISPLNDELTPLFGQADWFMGLQPAPSGKVRTVNTAKFVMPERYDPVFEETAKYVISINGVPWGLAVDTVEQPIRLSPEDVKWRTERSQRPWLAGTVKEHMCALLDIPKMGELLTMADRNAR